MIGNHLLSSECTLEWWVGSDAWFLKSGYQQKSYLKRPIHLHGVVFVWLIDNRDLWCCRPVMSAAMLVLSPRKLNEIRTPFGSVLNYLVDAEDFDSCFCNHFTSHWYKDTRNSKFWFEQIADMAKPNVKSWRTIEQSVLISLGNSLRNRPCVRIREMIQGDMSQVLQMLLSLRKSVTDTLLFDSLVIKYSSYRWHSCFYSMPTESTSSADTSASSLFHPID